MRSAICDFWEDHQDERIRVIKDISAAAVGISILVWAVTLIPYSARHFAIC